MHRLFSLTCILLTIASIAGSRSAQAEGDYNMGAPILKEIWVDPVNGKDINDGTSRAKALQTLNYAMGIVQSSSPFATTGFRIMLVGGTYDQENSPSTYSTIIGTSKYPLIFKAADGPGTVILPPMSVSDCNYFYIDGVSVGSSFGQALSFSRCDHVFVKNATIDGMGAGNILAQNALTIIGSKYCYIEDCTLRNSEGALDSCAGVQYGHMFRCTLDSSGGDAVAISSGSAYLYIERNTISNVGGRGFSLGGTTYLDIDFVSPWLHYDCYDIRVDNNIVTNCLKQAFTVVGSYNVLIAYNTFYHCGSASASLFVAGLGRRTCYSDKATCSDLIAAGAWGTLHTFTTEDDIAWIPNKHLLIYNNMLYNPTGVETQFANISVWGPRKALVHATCPKPANADDDIEIKGNLIFNGSDNKPLGLEDSSGCQDTNVTCNKAMIVTENTVNLKEPILADPVHADYHPGTGSFLLSMTLYPAPNFVWNDLPGTPMEPAGDLVNAIAIDHDGFPRTSTTDVPGALVTPMAGVRADQAASFSVSQPSSNPASTSSTISVSTDVRTVINVAVFDLLGREVATVANRTIDIGLHSFTLPVSSLQSGTYLVRVAAGGRTLARQLVVSH